jgi:bifunctional non-homologous end joining protein LigD
MKKGELKFTLAGKKLKGSWVLVRTRDRQWLMIKHRDEAASTVDIATAAPTSIVTGRTLAQIAADEGGDAEKAASGDPQTVASVAKVRPRSSKKPSAAVWHSNR